MSGAQATCAAAHAAASMIFVTAALDQIETNNASNLRASVRIGRDIDSSEARAPQFGPRADAGLERAVGEAPTTDLYFFATFSQCVHASVRPHLGCDVCTWGQEGGGDAPGGAHLGL